MEKVIKGTSEVMIAVGFMMILISASGLDAPNPKSNIIVLIISMAVTAIGTRIYNSYT